MTDVQLEEYANFLNAHEYITEVHNEKLKLQINISHYDIILWCSFSDFFPYEIPEIHIDEESYSKLPRIPHLFRDHSICMFDKGKVVPNVNEPLNLVLDVVKAAINVIENGISGKNKFDYTDELLSYWSGEGALNAHMFIENLQDAKKVFWCLTKQNIILITDRIESTKKIYDSVEFKELPDTEIIEGLLIPLNEIILDSIPKTDIDIIKLIESNSCYKDYYNSFMQKNIEKGGLILLSLMLHGTRIVIGWYHEGPGIPNGFRKGHVHLKTAFKLTKSKGIRISIENCHQSRLFNRGGNGIIKIWEKVCIIGCGSVGSFITEALKLYGIDHFTIVDNDLLKCENIARHQCGYFWTDFPKVNAIKHELERHNPNITVDAYYENAHKFIEQSTAVINECDVTFIAVASPTVEHHINKLVLENKITKPLVFVWIEPYSLGGHALFIKEQQDLYKDIFNKDTLEYNFGIVQNGSNYMKREAGCQSSYMPYSGFHLQQFIYGMLEHLLSECWNKRGNYRITWCGKLSEAEKLDVQISENYKGVNEFSFIVKRID